MENTNQNSKKNGELKKSEKYKKNDDMNDYLNIHEKSSKSFIFNVKNNMIILTGILLLVILIKMVKEGSICIKPFFLIILIIIADIIIFFKYQ